MHECFYNTLKTLKRGVFPSSDINGGPKQPPSWFLKYSKNVISVQNMFIFLGYIANIFNRGADASNAILLKKALIPAGRLKPDEFFSTVSA